jgi:dolichol-phosphate mannosyltransferase
MLARRWDALARALRASERAESVTARTYSLVIPIYNEHETIPVLFERVRAVIDRFDGATEVILVDDGSADDSWRLLAELHARDARFKALSLSRNFGHQVAVTAGLDHARGDAVMVLDGDLQDPPEVLPALIERWKEGYDVVYAVRTKRKENVVKRAAYALFYRILKQLSELDIPLDSGDFCLLDRKVLAAMKLLPERNRFVRGIRTWVGYKQTGCVYERDRRFAGDSKYTLTKLMGLAYDGIFSVSTLPLRLAVYVGFGLSGLAILGACWVVYEKIFRGIALVGWPSTMTVMTLLGGFILSTLGVIGEYVSRIYQEVKQRPLYLLKSKMGYEDTSVG